MIACQFLRDLIDAFLYRLHTILTENGVQFCHTPHCRDGPTARIAGHLFGHTCAEHGIKHRLTKPNHPWTNGQVERMNRTIKDATVQRYYYASYDELRRHLQLFINYLQSCQGAQNAAGPNALSICHSAVDERTKKIQGLSVKLNPGAEHLASIDIIKPDNIILIEFIAVLNFDEDHIDIPLILNSMLSLQWDKYVGTGANISLFISAGC